MSFHSNEVASPATTARTAAETDLLSACNSVMILPWIDPLADPCGHDPRSTYTEMFWLGTLGPTVTWLIRFTAYLLDGYPQGITVHPDEICLRIGIGCGTGPNSALMKAVRRCIRFELARLPLPVEPHRYSGEHASNSTLTLEVRKRLPLLPVKYLDRLPEQMRKFHERYVHDLITA